MYQISTECTIYRPYFQYFLGFPNYRFRKASKCTNSRSYYKKTGLRARGLLHTPLMTSKHVLFLLIAVSNIVSECVTIMYAKASKLCLQFQIVSNEAPFSVLVSMFSLKLEIVSNTARIHHYASLFSKFPLQFQIVSNNARMHHLVSLFSKSSL